MNIQAICFGGIGTLVETSELQRQAFNSAFGEAGIAWHWDVETYRQLLSTPGGQRRIRAYDESRPGGARLSDIDVVALHERKTEIFQQLLSENELYPRAGVKKLLNSARNADVRVAIASTTSLANIESLAAESRLDLDDFDVVLHRGNVERPKPDPQVYERCLHVLGIAAIHAVAIEDSDSGVEAAVTAGLECIAVPGENTARQNYGRASLVVDDLDGILEPAAEHSQAFSPRITGLDLRSFRELVADIR